MEDRSDPTANQYGVKATTRFGLGILRSNAIAKMTNIKTKVYRQKAFCFCFEWMWLVAWASLFWLCFGLCLVVGWGFLLLLEVG